jgi:transcriptional regulator with XRE-family HTH domain
MNKRKKITRLKIILMQRGLSQTDFAKMVGMHNYEISNLCSGKKVNLFLETAKKISNALNLTLDDVFGD